MKIINANLAILLIITLSKLAIANDGSTIGAGDPNACLLTFEKISKPTPLCGSYGELPTWKRGLFNVTYKECPSKPKEIVREDFIECSDPT